VINLIGKTLAVIFVGLSIMLMTFAAALWFNAVDLGWKQPARVYHESESRKPGELVAVAGRFDKHEAAIRKLIRLKQDALLRLGNAQASYVEVEPYLGQNRLKGDAELARLETGPGDKIDIRDFKLDENTGALLTEPGTSRQLGFPLLETVVPNISAPYNSYLAKLREIDLSIDSVQNETTELIAKEKEKTDLLIGEVDKDGNSRRENGAVTKPGWYYLTEAEIQTQKQLQKELEYIQPLWVKELVDAQLLVSRRDVLMRRLNELGARDYLSQSEFLKKLQ
jgi:hypothetical protein